MVALGWDAAGSTPPPSLTSASTTFSLAVSAYARALSLDVDFQDEASVARFTAALASIDTFRVVGKDDVDDDVDTGGVDTHPLAPGEPPPPFPNG